MTKSDLTEPQPGTLANLSEARRACPDPAIGGNDELSSVVTDDGKSMAQVMGALAVDPRMRNSQAAMRLARFDLKSDYSMSDMCDALSGTIANVRAGNLASAEATLVAQSVTLDAIFTSLVNRAVSNMVDYPVAFERYMRLALKAQSQCRATLETLAAIKNPSVVYAKQANFAAGHQQVNNGVGSDAGAGETENPQTELLVTYDGEI